MFFFVTYVIPIVILTITYTRIALDLWGQTGSLLTTMLSRDREMSRCSDW